MGYLNGEKWLADKLADYQKKDDICSNCGARPCLCEYQRKRRLMGDQERADEDAASAYEARMDRAMRGD